MRLTVIAFLCLGMSACADAIPADPGGDDGASDQGTGGTAQRGTGGAPGPDQTPMCELGAKEVTYVTGCPEGPRFNKYGTLCAITCTVTGGSEVWGCQVKWADRPIDCLGTTSCDYPGSGCLPR